MKTALKEHTHFSGSGVRGQGSDGLGVRGLWVRGPVPLHMKLRHGGGQALCALGYAAPGLACRWRGGSPSAKSPQSLFPNGNRGCAVSATVPPHPHLKIILLYLFFRI